MIVQVLTAFVQAKLFEEQVVTRQLLSSCLSRSPSKSLRRTCFHFPNIYLKKVFTIGKKDPEIGFELDSN